MSKKESRENMRSRKPENRHSSNRKNVRKNSRPTGGRENKSFMRQNLLKRQPEKRWKREWRLNAKKELERLRSISKSKNVFVVSSKKNSRLKDNSVRNNLENIEKSKRQKLIN